VPIVNPTKYVGIYQLGNIEAYNVSLKDDGTLVMGNLRDQGTRFEALYLSYVNEGTLRLYFPGKA